jgi:hypothetical protein
VWSLDSHQHTYRWMQLVFRTAFQDMLRVTSSAVRGLLSAMLQFEKLIWTLPVCNVSAACWNVRIDVRLLLAQRLQLAGNHRLTLQIQKLRPNRVTLAWICSQQTLVAYVQTKHKRLWGISHSRQSVEWLEDCWKFISVHFGMSDARPSCASLLHVLCHDSFFRNVQFKLL